MRQFNPRFSLAAAALAELTYYYRSPPPAPHRSLATTNTSNAFHPSHAPASLFLVHADHKPTPSPSPSPSPPTTPNPYTMYRQSSPQSNNHHPAFGDAHSPPSHHPSTSTSPSSLHHMVPITYELLQEHYARFPSPSISPQLTSLRHATVSLRNSMLVSTTSTTVNEITAEPLPASLDNSMYRLRCACEEAAQRLDHSPVLTSFSNRLITLSKTFEAFQAKQSEHVSKVVNEFLPQDFRATFFNAARQHSERSNVNALNELIASGGSVREKYSMLWEQQWKRRETLASVGNATGIWKWLVKYLAGVPEPLLQFAKDINSPKGPTEALRAKFGSALSQLTTFAIELNAFCAAVVLANSLADRDFHEHLDRSITCYEQEVDKFVHCLETVITNSPFFVEPDQIAALKAEIAQ